MASQHSERVVGRPIGLKHAWPGAAARGLVRTLIIAGALLSAAACRPLYLPLIPDPPPYEAGVRVADFEAVLDLAGRPTLQLSLADLTESGWLAVQWLAPTGREVASESVWAEQRQAEDEEGSPVAAGSTNTIVFVLPADVVLTPGEWRAVVSFGGQLLRQFRFDVD